MNESQSLAQYLCAGGRPDLLLVDFNHPAGSQYFHNGLGIFEYDDNEYFGVGGLGRIELAAHDGAEVAITQDRLVLSGVDPDILDTLDTSVKGGNIIIRQVFLRPDFSVDVEIAITQADMDFMVDTVSNGVAEIALVANGGFRELRARSSAAWDQQDQRNYLTSLGEDPDSDTGFDLMSEMRDTLIVSQAE